MATRQHLMVFSYDVRKDSVRAKVSGLLEAELARVQKSVFEGRLSREESHDLARRVLALLDEGDSLRVYAVTPLGLKNSIAHGGAPLAEPHAFWIL
jgi:CRISPR-associated endonuclease Cas2